MRSQAGRYCSEQGGGGLTGIRCHQMTSSQMPSDDVITDSTVGGGGADLGVLGLGGLLGRARGFEPNMRHLGRQLPGREDRPALGMHLAQEAELLLHDLPVQRGQRRQDRLDVLRAEPA